MNDFKVNLFGNVQSLFNAALWIFVIGSWIYEIVKAGKSRNSKRFKCTLGLGILFVSVAVVVELISHWLVEVGSEREWLHSAVTVAGLCVSAVFLFAVVARAMRSLKDKNWRNKGLHDNK